MPNPIYSISKWDETFVKADGRKSKGLHWVSLPVDLTCDGYQTLVEENPAEAATIYGAWCAMVCVASQCSIPGVFANSKGDGFSVTRISSLCFLPKEVIERTIEWAAGSTIGWLKVDNSKTEIGEEVASTSETETVSGCNLVDSEDDSKMHPDGNEENTKVHPDGNQQTAKMHPDGNSGFFKNVESPSRLQDSTIHNNTVQNIFTSFENDDCVIPKNPKEVFQSFKDRAIQKPALSNPSVLTASRSSKIKTRLNEEGWAESYVLALSKLPLGGSWQPDLDWLIKNDSNALKVAEGNYDNWKDEATSKADFNKGATYDPNAHYGEGF